MSGQRFSNVVYPNVRAKMKAFNLYQTVSILYHYGHIGGCAAFDNPTLDKYQACPDDPEGRTEWKIYLSYPDNRRLYEFRQNVLRAKEKFVLETFIKEHPMNAIPWHPVRFVSLLYHQGETFISVPRELRCEASCDLHPA